MAEPNAPSEIQNLFSLTADVIIAIADAMGLVCTLSIDLRKKDGTRVVKLDAHGEHELEGKT